MPATLVSWNDTPTRAAIIDFVERTTTPGSPDYLEPAVRIAVFDNDGTLWTEQPVYNQVFFTFDRVRALAPEHPEWATTHPFQAVLENDHQALAELERDGLMTILAATHAGMTADAFSDIVRHWIAEAEHPRWKRPYPATAYAPMIELLQYLRANDYQTFVVSGGGVEFMRAFAVDAYGIPPNQMVGSTIKTEFHMIDGVPQLVRLPEVDFFDDGPGKPIAIGKFIGMRPVMAFGNTDGDLQMLQYTAAGAGPRFMALVTHDDDEREVAYAVTPLGTLDKALAYAREHDWVVISMKHDFATVFGD